MGTKLENPVQIIRQQRIFKALQEEIKEVEKACEKGDHVVISSHGILVESVDLASGELVIIRGKDGNGNPVRLIQHIEMLSLVVSKLHTDDEEDEESGRKIGFRERSLDD
jgi:hypothetical protein